MFKAANYFFNGKYDVEQDMETAFYFYKHSSDKGYPPGDFFFTSVFYFKFKLRKSFSHVFASLHVQKRR